MYNFGVDWLSVYCKGIAEFAAPWHVQRQEYSTQQYKYVDFLYFNNDHFATVTHTPHSAILDKLGMIIKLENRYLYSSRYPFILSKMLAESNIKFVGISRLDLFLDFQEFLNNLNPQIFIEKVFNLEILKNGRSKFATQGATAQKINFEYLKFGTRSANSLVYLYNKTKELQEVKDKEYIRETWTASGYDPTRDVWRLEYSFKPSKHGVIDLEDADYSHLTISDLSDIKKLKFIYKAALNQYFSFKINKGTKNKTEMPDFDLFPENSSHFKLAYIPSIPDDVQQAKRLIKILWKQRQECDTNYQILKNSIDDTILGLASKFKLADYVQKRYGLIFRTY